MAASTPICDFGLKAPDFRLLATDGRTYALSDVKGPRGTLVMFICNHCPYVQAVLDRIVRDARELQGLGIGCVAISSNDAEAYPEDGFEAMKREAEAHACRSPTSMTKRKRLQRLTGPSARRISSATTPPSSCNIAAGSMPAARRPRPLASAGTFSRP